MKRVVFICLAIVLSSCTSERSKEGGKLLADDVRLFRDTPVWEVAQSIDNDNVEKIIELLEGKHDSLLNYQENTYGQSLLEWAVYTNHLSSVKILAELGANPNLQSLNGTSAFIHAAGKFETSEYLKLLMEHGGDLNAESAVEDQRLRTPLVAASYSNLENVKILAEKGADVNYYYPKGFKSPLNSAFTYSKIEIIHYLVIKKGANVKKAFSVTASGDSVFITNKLRNLTFPLGSKEYTLKMEVVEVLQDRGMNYWETPIPKHFFDNYDSSYLERY